jgi:hypothetical protein
VQLPHRHRFRVLPHAVHDHRFKFAEPAHFASVVDPVPGL